MNNSCVILSCSIFSEERIFVLREFLKSLEDNFSEVDVYIGINYGCLGEIENIIKEYRINSVVSRLEDPSLYSESDASAYQIALKSLRESNKKYKYYWFIHTKSGVNSHSDYLRGWYIRKLIKRKNHIESFLNDNPEFGSYGMIGLEFDDKRVYKETDLEIPLFQNVKTNTLPFNHAPFFYIHSLYVIEGRPIEIFFNSVSDYWFNNKLDRYYFEGVFPFIVSRSGYIPYISNRISCTGLDLKLSINNWVNKEINKKIDIKYETLQTFLQLKPTF